ncbi:MAG: ADP-ribosylglycohydrolase family protein [Abitibacteriaceae bacterium]|nr:ADP-ribosylglycohydrolase family protein [Abditibacteriaceae bacterium]MBV9864943.1 ADP-ribosylglycohydrolase family protein [Abditibacteriaceae bacterium]
MAPSKADAIIGCVLGTAIGDAIGLCCEGLTRRRQQKLYPTITGPNLWLGRGMVSDDTEHTCMVAQALIMSAGQVDIFEQSLARQLKMWLLGLPAGTGKATAQAVTKLWLGFGVKRSGVFSAGNGPAMRSTIIGVCYGHDATLMVDLVRVSTCLTHTDPKAEWGAIAVAIAAYMASPQTRVAPNEYYEALAQVVGQEATELLALVQQAVTFVATGRSTEEFAAEIGLSNGVSGYVNHTVPVALYAWLRHGNDYRAAVLDIVRCGGDTDSTAAIVGGIIGAAGGKASIPAEWLQSLAEWPRTINWMEALGERLAEVCEQGMPQRALPLSFLGLWFRNVFFLCVVLLHGWRRLLPPY